MNTPHTAHPLSLLCEDHHQQQQQQHQGINTQSSTSSVLSLSIYATTNTVGVVLTRSHSRHNLPHGLKLKGSVYLWSAETVSANKW